MNVPNDGKTPARRKLTDEERQRLDARLSGEPELPAYRRTEIPQAGRRADGKDSNIRHIDPYGLPEIFGTIVTSTVMLGSIVLLDGMAWSWALGKGLKPGLVIGAIVGGVVGALAGLMASGYSTRRSRQAIAGGIGGCLGGPLLLIGAIGAIVGVVQSYD